LTRSEELSSNDIPYRAGEKEGERLGRIRENEQFKVETKTDELGDGDGDRDKSFLGSSGVVGGSEGENENPGDVVETL
jgi:hypothetical protein